MNKILWMCFIVSLLLVAQNWYTSEQINRGKAISSFLAYYHNLEIPPEEARHFTVTITTLDITIEDLDIFEAIKGQK